MEVSGQTRRKAEMRSGIRVDPNEESCLKKVRPQTCPYSLTPDPSSTMSQQVEVSRQTRRKAETRSSSRVDPNEESSLKKSSLANLSLFTDLPDTSSTISQQVEVSRQTRRKAETRPRSRVDPNEESSLKKSSAANLSLFTDPPPELRNSTARGPKQSSKFRKLLQASANNERTARGLVRQSMQSTPSTSICRQRHREIESLVFHLCNVTQCCLLLHMVPNPETNVASYLCMRTRQQSSNQCGFFRPSCQLMPLRTCSSKSQPRHIRVAPRIRDSRSSLLVYDSEKSHRDGW